MNKFFIFFLVSLLFAEYLFSQPVNLKCEYQIDPIGIDHPSPRLSWNFNDIERNWFQSAYNIVVSASDNFDKGIVWNSGKVLSTENVHIAYSGKPLKSATVYYWKVKVWDKNNKESDWSKVAFFSMGLLNKNDWKAKWIASDIKLKGYQEDLKKYTDFGMEPETEIWDLAKKLRKIGDTVSSAPAVYMRKEFLINKTIKSAVVYISGLGLHELYINGEKMGGYLDPASSDYQKRVYYLVHDVTKYLKTGNNAIGVILGNGWYNLIIPHVLRYYAADYIAPPKLLLQLHIQYDDGTSKIIPSGKDWKFTTDGPITFNCILGGETYNAGKELYGWNLPGFDEKNWKECLLTKAPEGKLVSQQLPPVKVIEKFPAQKVVKKDSVYIFDIGKEIVGWAKVRIKGKPGKKIAVYYPGAQSHTLGRYQTTYYIPAGNEEETYEPRFCYNGFRYVYVSGLDYEPKPEDVIGMQVCSAMEPAGEFSCSNEKLTKLQEILLHTIRNYILHLPNDPTREKAAWTQDIQNGFDVNAYNFNCALMYSKWQDDFLDIIHKNGYVPPVAPGRFDGPTINGPWWGGMIVYNPWKIYQYYNDKRILEISYPKMKLYLNYLKSISENYIVKWGLGDWLEPGTVRPKITPIPLTSTCGFYLYANILKQSAEILGKKNEAKEYSALAEKIKLGYNKEFLKDGIYALGSQAGQIMSLYFGLVPEQEKEIVINKLLRIIQKDSVHVNTGFVSTPILLMALSELGFPDIAYKMATQNSYPSWFDMVFNKGNTVFKESWDGGLVQMPSLGGVLGAWYYHSLGGVRIDPSAPGFKQIIINPDIIPELKWVKTNYKSIQGNIISNWEISGNDLKLFLTIPPNTTASVFLPSGKTDNIFENDLPINKNEQIKYAGIKNNKSVFLTGSGIYNITIKNFNKFK